MTDGGNAGDVFGFARGFDRFDDRGGGIEKGARRVVRLLGEVGTDAPSFVFLHTYEVHSPYRPAARQRALLGVPDEAPAASSAICSSTRPTPPPCRRASSTRSPASTTPRSASSTTRCAPCSTSSRRSGFLRDAVVIVTSDHGEEFGEHGGLLHRDLLYDVLLQVPLIVSGPGIEPARRSEPVSSVDIAPTVLELARIAAPAAMEGSSLLRPRRRGAVIAQYGSSRYAIRTREWKLIRSASGATELYDLRADPGERDNVAGSHAEVVATLGAALDRWREQHQGGARSGAPVDLTADSGASSSRSATCARDKPMPASVQPMFLRLRNVLDR